MNQALQKARRRANTTSRSTSPVQSCSISRYATCKTSPSAQLVLTSPQIADTHFRRQFLFQLLILLHHLLTFTKTAKATWSTPRNRSLQIDFTLEAADAQWVQETITRATEELRQTAPNGRAFAETVQVILEREKNWVRWKNELCTPFDREPWSEEVEENGVKRKVGLEEATEEVRKKMRMDPEPWPHRYGSAPLTEIWEMGYRDLYDLQHPFQYVSSRSACSSNGTHERPSQARGRQGLCQEDQAGRPAYRNAQKDAHQAGRAHRPGARKGSAGCRAQGRDRHPKPLSSCEQLSSLTCDSQLYVCVIAGRPQGAWHADAAAPVAAREAWSERRERSSISWSCVYAQPAAGCSSYSYAVCPSAGADSNCAASRRADHEARGGKLTDHHSLSDVCGSTNEC